MAIPALLAMIDANCHPAPAGKTREIITSMLLVILFKKILSFRGCADVAQNKELAPCTQVCDRRDGVWSARAALPPTGTWKANELFTDTAKKAARRNRKEAFKAMSTSAGREFDFVIN